MTDSPLDQVLETVRAALHGRRAVALERALRVERALAEYVSALDEQIGREFAREHGLHQPKASHDVQAAAQALRDAVLALPELARASPDHESERELSEQAQVPSAPPSARPHLAPIVVVGGVGRKVGTVPAEHANRLEWIDTTRQGTVAIGNLTHRIRSGRVAALVLLEGLVGHRHSEPLVAAAREANIPFVFAGKGGKASFERALADVLRRLP